MLILYDFISIFPVSYTHLALDRKTEEQIFDNLRKMTAGSTVLLISHRLYPVSYTHLGICSG